MNNWPEIPLSRNNKILRNTDVEYTEQPILVRAEPLIAIYHLINTSLCTTCYLLVFRLCR